MREREVKRIERRGLFLIIAVGVYFTSELLGIPFLLGDGKSVEGIRRYGDGAGVSAILALGSFVLFFFVDYFFTRIIKVNFFQRR